MNRRAIAKARVTGGGSGFGLPADMLAEAVRRLGWAALAYSLCYFVVYLAYRHSDKAAEFHVPFFDVLLVVALALGIGLFLLTRRQNIPGGVILSAGLVFEVVSSLLIAVSEHHLPYVAGQPIRGFSALAAWIPTFSLLVPAGRVPTAVAAFSSAAMGPLALWLQVSLRGITPPVTNDLPVVLIPPFLMAGVAVVLSQTMYQLGVRVSQEREMGSYRLVERIGQGGMGEVWRAEHRLLAREAAIKLIAPVTGAESLAVFRQRFEREARAIAALQSPHTVTLFDYGMTDEGRLYYVMELLRGLDLEELVSRFGPLPPARAAFLLAQICASLEEAHAAGLTHRDIKPRNVLVGRLGAEADFVKVLDFGLVKDIAAKEELQITRPEATTGTPAYMAPEVALGSSFDGRADIYSLGCTAYWLLTGRLVFEGKTGTAVLMEHVNSQPVSPSRRVETAIPAAFDELVLQCLAKNPTARPPTAGALRRQLNQWASGWSQEMATNWWNAHRPAPQAATKPVPPTANATTV